MSSLCDCWCVYCEIDDAFPDAKPDHCLSCEHRARRCVKLGEAIARFVRRARVADLVEQATRRRSTAAIYALARMAMEER